MKPLGRDSVASMMRGKKHKPRYTNKDILPDLDSPPDISAIAERSIAKRVTAPKSITAKFCGDPVMHSLPAPRKQKQAIVGIVGKQCQFPIGDPGHTDFQFCEDMRISGKPYCSHHYSICYRDSRYRPRVNIAPIPGGGGAR